MEKVPEKSEDTEKKEENISKDSQDKNEEKAGNKSTKVEIAEYGLKCLEEGLNYLREKDKNETSVKLKELEIQENAMKERLKFYEERLKEMEERDKKKEKEEEEKKNKVKNGMKEWNIKEKELIQNFLNEINFDLIKKIMENNKNSAIAFEGRYSKINRPVAVVSFFPASAFASIQRVHVL